VREKKKGIVGNNLQRLQICQDPCSPWSTSGSGGSQTPAKDTSYTILRHLLYTNTADTGPG